MQTRSRVLAWIESQWFSVSLVGLFLLAWRLPGLAPLVGGHGWTKSAAVVAIFFLSGLGLKAREAIAGLANWRLHLYVQGFSFVVIPLLCWLALAPFRTAMPHGLTVGFFVLAVLPTTITTCVVLTQLAGGSVAGALFNSIAANLAGVFVSPALLLLMIGSSDMGVELDAAGTFLKLGRLILIPLVAGQVVRRLAGERAKAVSRPAAVVNRCGVLLIVYLAFGETFSSRAGAGSVAGIVWPLALLVPAHLVVLWLAWVGSRWARLDWADRVAALFCAPQKTLALGLPLVGAMLAGAPELVGLASLPIIVYHPVQLLVAGVLVDRLRGAQNKQDPAGDNGRG